MKILTRYILRETTIFFLISLFAFTSILVTLKIVQFTALIINKGVSLSQIGMVFVSIVPMFLELAIPMASLLGVMLAFARLSGDSEIVIVRASGISLSQLLTPIIIFGSITALATLYVCVELGPKGQEILNKTLFDIAKAKTSAGINDGIFNKLGGMTLYAESIDHQTGSLERVLVDDKRVKDSRKIVISKKGQLSSDEEARTITLFLQDGYIHEVPGGKYVLTKFDDNSIIIATDEIDGTQGEKKDRRTREMFLDELSKNIEMYSALLEARKSGELPEPEVEEEGAASEHAEQALKAAQEAWPADYRSWTTDYIRKKLNRMQVERARRFSMPCAAFLLALFAMPLGIQPPRTQRAWGATLSMGLGMLVFAIYYGLLSIGIAIAEGGGMNHYLAVWIPNLVAAAGAFYSIKQVASERWQSIAHGFEELMMAVLTRMRLVRTHENTA